MRPANPTAQGEDAVAKRERFARADVDFAAHVGRIPGVVVQCKIVGADVTEAPVSTLMVRVVLISGAISDRRVLIGGGS